MHLSTGFGDLRTGFRPQKKGKTEIPWRGFPSCALYFTCVQSLWAFSFLKVQDQIISCAPSGAREGIAKNLCSLGVSRTRLGAHMSCGLVPSTFFFEVLWLGGGGRKNNKQGRAPPIPGTNRTKWRFSEEFNRKWPVVPGTAPGLSQGRDRPRLSQGLFLFVPITVQSSEVPKKSPSEMDP